MIGSFDGTGQAESRHERQQLSFEEIPLTDVPDVIGESWRGTAYLPRHEGPEWRSAFTQAYRASPSLEEPNETLYALVNKGNPDAGEFVSFAVMRGTQFICNSLSAFNTQNRDVDKHLPPLYTDQAVAFLIATRQADQKQGIGRRTVIAMNDFSINRYGKPLHSDLERYHLSGVDGQKPGWRTWKSLERDGFVDAYETPHGTRYSFKPAGGSDEHGRFTF